MRRTSLAFAILLLLPAVLQAAPPTLVELTAGDRNYQGRVYATNDTVCWLLDRDGRLNRVELGSVSGYRTVDTNFQPQPAWQVKPLLQKELGDDFEIAEKGQYIVGAPRGQARAYATILDGVSSDYHRYFSRRRFQLDRIEFPLIAIVFPDRRSFEDYATKDGFQPPENLIGYYLCESNRITLYDPGVPQASLPRTPTAIGDFFAPPARERVELLRSSGADSYGSLMSTDVATALRDTIAHEGTHQLAFNTGLHNRVGERATWVVEGLATMLEAPGIFDGHSDGDRPQRINRERFAHLLELLPGQLAVPWVEEFVASNQMFKDSPLDAYAIAWGLSFYLVETRSSDYGKYVRQTAARDPLKPYPDTERLRDFKAMFGSKPAIFESGFRKFYAELAEDMARVAER